jgi:AcrR family transcriptional regulator
VISQSMNNKREIILKTALDLFVNQGFHATPTSLIASKAGVANGTLFHYFKTKEELINILYLETKDQFFNQITYNFQPSETLKTKIYTIWINSINWALENSNEFKFIQQFSNSSYISHLTHEQIALHHRFFENQFKEGIDNRIIKDIEIPLLLQLALAQIYGFISYVYENQEKRYNQESINQAFNCFWDSIKA